MWICELIEGYYRCFCRILPSHKAKIMRLISLQFLTWSIRTLQQNRMFSNTEEPFVFPISIVHTVLDQYIGFSLQICIHLNFNCMGSRFFRCSNSSFSKPFKRAKQSCISGVFEKGVAFHYEMKTNTSNTFPW